MSRYELFDRSRMELRSLALRGHDLQWSDCLPLTSPSESFSHPEFADLTHRIAEARKCDRPVILMMGAQPRQC